MMLPIPPEMLSEMSLEAGQDVLLSSEEGAIQKQPSVPRSSPDAVEFMARFTKQYGEAMSNLARR